MRQPAPGSVHSLQSLGAPPPSHLPSALPGVLDILPWGPHCLFMSGNQADKTALLQAIHLKNGKRGKNLEPKIGKAGSDSTVPAPLMVPECQRRMVTVMHQT